LLVTCHSSLVPAVKKRLRRFQLLESGATLFPFSDHRSNQMGKWQFRMYTQELPFVSRKFAWRSTLSGRHLICFHISSHLFWRTRCRLVFVVVAFPPPPVTSPATRLRRLAPNEATDASPWLFLSAGGHPFLSGRFRKASQPSLASLSASALGVNRERQPPVFPLEPCVTATFAFPLAGHAARERRD
jgi:hypothetical protein